MNLKKKNIIKLYNLSKKVVFCKKCTISNQRPRITFDKKGVCSACNFADVKKRINWEERKTQFKKLLDQYRKKDGTFDVLVPCSGGKDGSMVAYKLKYEYGMNPLCVTWAPLKYTEIGKKNLENFVKSGFNHILGTPNPEVTRKLTEASFKALGDPFQPFIYGQINFPLNMAVKYNIPLIMYAENQEAEYGGDTSKARKPTRDINDFTKYYFSGKHLDSWNKYGINYRDLNFFSGPSIKSVISLKLKIHFFGYYHYWDPQENYYFCQKYTGLTPNYERTEGTYSRYASLDDKFDGFHFYLAYIKFGIGRATSDSAHEIRDNKIDREEGISLVKKYDHEFPIKYFNEFLDYCSLNKNEFEKIIDSWRSDHLWLKAKNGKWVLKNSIY